MTVVYAAPGDVLPDGGIMTRHGDINYCQPMFVTKAQSENARRYGWCAGEEDENGLVRIERPANVIPLQAARDARLARRVV
jgi:hypothetical protein